MNNTEALNKKELTAWQIWYLAIRPKTLPAAAGPVAIGIGLALGDGVFRFGPALAALLAALLLQIGSNLANDVFDYQKGTDTQDRKGPLRVTQAGLLSPRQVMMGMIIVFVLAAIIGLYLISVGGLPILVVGVLAIISAIIYTAGPFPLGYNGIADIFVFAFFGPVALCGTYYLQSGIITPAAWWASIPPGLLVTAILVVNNLRDIETDRQAGKKTLAVRFGIKFTQIQYVLLVGLPYVLSVIIGVSGNAPYSVFIVWLSLPLAMQRIRDIYTKQGTPLNTTLAGTAKLQLVYSLLFAAGYFVGS